MPGKAAYLELENDPELEFEHFLGEKLGRTVAEVRDMDHAEFVRWSRYYMREGQRRELECKMAGLT